MGAVNGEGSPSDGDVSIDEDELLEALEEEEGAESEGTGAAPGSEAVRKKSLESLGGDLLLRIMGMLSVAQLCTLSGRATPAALRPPPKRTRAPRPRPRGAAPARWAPLRSPHISVMCVAARGPDARGLPQARLGGRVPPQMATGSGRRYTLSDGTIRAPTTKNARAAGWGGRRYARRCEDARVPCTCMLARAGRVMCRGCREVTRCRVLWLQSSFLTSNLETDQ